MRMAELIESAPLGATIVCRTMHSRGRVVRLAYAMARPDLHAITVQAYDEAVRDGSASRRLYVFER